MQVFDSVLRGQEIDHNGHGQWCAGCIGGKKTLDRRASQKANAYVVTEGIAPECDLIGIKTLGFIIGCGSSSSCIDGINLAVERYGCEVLNLSLGGPCEVEKPEDDPYFEVFEELKKINVIPVCAAGNSGPGERTIGSPGALPNCITVGAYDPFTGEVAEFSSRGPTPWDEIKPDTIAPGVRIDAPVIGSLDKSGDQMKSRYDSLSGTSMSTPPISGIIILMKEIWYRVLGRPLTLDEILTMLSQLGIEKTNNYGWGPLNYDLITEWLSTEYGVEL